MATFQKFKQFPGDAGKGLHNLSTDVLRIYLSNAAPNATSHRLKSEVAEIAAGNGYSAGGFGFANAGWAFDGNRWTYQEDSRATPPQWIADGGAIGPFRYLILYNDTSADDLLIGFWDHGQEVTLNNGDIFTASYATPNELFDMQ